MKEYPETHKCGFISIDREIKLGIVRGDLGIRISQEGRIWVCIDGISFLRFRPERKGKKRIINEIHLGRRTDKRATGLRAC